MDREAVCAGLGGGTAPVAHSRFSRALSLFAQDLRGTTVPRPLARSPRLFVTSNRFSTGLQRKDVDHLLWGRTLAKHNQDACAVAYADDGYFKAKLFVALEVLSDIKQVLKEDAGLASMTRPRFS